MHKFYITPRLELIKPSLQAEVTRLSSQTKTYLTALLPEEFIGNIWVLHAEEYEAYDLAELLVRTAYSQHKIELHDQLYIIHESCVAPSELLGGVWEVHVDDYVHGFKQKVERPNSFPIYTFSGITLDGVPDHE